MNLRIIKFICIIYGFFGFFLDAQENVCLTGKLVKKYYQAPPEIKNPAFGWYLELDNSTQEFIQHQFRSLKQEDQRVFESLDADLKIVQFVTWNDDILNKVRSLENEVVKVEGKISEPYLCRTFLCFSIEVDALSPVSKFAIKDNHSLSTMDNLSKRFRRNSDLEYDEKNPLKLPQDVPEQLVILRGQLVLKLFAGPPEYTSIEGGDRADYCLMLKLDKTSFNIAITTPVPEPADDLSHILEWSNHDEIDLLVDEDMQDYLYKNINKFIAVEGYLFHAHTAHHYTPILMDVRKLNQIEE